MKTILKASVKSGRPEDNGKRIIIRCTRDTDGNYRWSDEEGDCEVSGKTKQAAKDAAERAWAGEWDLRATWLRGGAR